MANPIYNSRGDELLYGGEIDPRVTPVDAPKGAMFIYAPEDGVTDPEILQKNDDGLTTNWGIYTTGMATDLSNADPSVADQLIDHSAVSITGTDSLTGGGDLTASSTISLVNDAAAPGNSKYYGTDAGGVKGYFDFPASGITWSTPVDANVIPDITGTRNLGSISSAWNQFYVQQIYGRNGGDTRWNLSANLLQTAPSGASVDHFFNGESDLSAPSKAWLFQSVNNNTNDGNKTSDLRFETGNKLAGTGDSGSIHLNTGTSVGGSRGVINLQESLVKVCRVSDYTSTWWGSPVAGLEFDGPNSTDIQNGGAAAIVWRGDQSNNYGLILTEDVTSGSTGTIGVQMATGAQLGGGSSGTLEIWTGDSQGTGGNSGAFFLSTGILSGSGTGNSGNVSMETGGVFGTRTGNSGTINLITGNSTNGNSGDLNLRVGTAGGTQGNFKFLRVGDAPAVGEVWTCSNSDGTGYWAPAAAGGANTSLSNLSSVAINENLIFSNVLTTTRTIGFTTAFGGSSQGDNLTVTTAPKTSGTGGGTGDTIIRTGDISGGGTTGGAGNINIQTGLSNTNDAGFHGSIFLNCGQNAGASATPPSVRITSGRNVTGNIAGDIILRDAELGGANSGGHVDCTQMTGTVKFPTHAADPSDAVNGSVWYNTTSNQLKAYVNGSVVVIA